MKQSGHPVPSAPQACLEDRLGSSGHRKTAKVFKRAKLSSAKLRNVLQIYIDFSVSVFLLLMVLTGCMHSHVIQITVTNTSAERISTMTIDYPEATFGINSLEPGKSFRYKIKPTASGALKIEFHDARGVAHASSGPVVHKNDEGSIQIKLTQNEAISEAQLDH